MQAAAHPLRHGTYLLAEGNCDTPRLDGAHGMLHIIRYKIIQADHRAPRHCQHVPVHVSCVR